MKTAIISSKTSTNHLTGDGHPEQPKRVTAITERLKKNKSLIWDKPTSFDQNILKKVKTTIIESTLIKYKGNKKKTTEELGINNKDFDKLLKDLKISKNLFKSD